MPVNEHPFYQRHGLFPSLSRPGWGVPSDKECFAWWDRYEMPEHIRQHSLLGADVATAIAEMGREAGLPVCVQTVRASTLLHDLAKYYTIRHGGSHAQLGAAWAMQLTGNPLLAMGVLHHIYWPFEMDAERYFTPLTVLYADKRAMHETLVSVRTRFDDLIVRYGHTPEIQEKIRWTVAQVLEIERLLGALLGKDLDAYPFDSGRLVGRA